MTANTKTISEGALLGKLMHKHRGKGMGVTAKALAEELTGLDPAFGSQAGIERHIRTLVVDLRNKGIPICASPSQGYYIAKTPDELESTCEHLRERAMTSLRQIAGLRRLSMPQLLGQIGIDEQTDSPCSSV